MSAKDVVRNACKRFGVKKDSLVAKLSAGVDSAWKANKAKGSRGLVHCGRVWRGQPKQDMPCRDDSMSIFVSAGKGQIGTALSPFTVHVPGELMSWATVDGTPGGDPLPGPQKLELVWQAAKVSKGESWKAYLARRVGIYAKKVPKRRYIEKGSAIGGACFGGEEDKLVEYVPSRVFYCTAYEKAVSELPEMKLLKALVDDGFNLLLLGPDGHPIEAGGKHIRRAYADPSVPFGHERVLVAMLRGERPWAEASRCWRG
eukprot:TRINITY_DN48967_c0_g1_i1.p1 TRINITY_DN48967_c0_g1~~TRINITY_DN48967_c0_g1_i1.p1  ORF type:complete len:258 (-),score=43.12 TRINITY_DN48967_c0_g1_i1:213-986(-)